MSNIETTSIIAAGGTLMKEHGVLQTRVVPDTLHQRSLQRKDDIEEKSLQGQFQAKETI